MVVVVALAKKGRRARRVYLAEVSSGSKPIEAVGTSIAAFVGFDPR
jgi:phage tail sheath protein FI